MALTIEDGTGVANAESYASVAELDVFAVARGVTLSAVEADKEVLLRAAFDHVEALRADFKGTKANTGNTFSQWPREDVQIDGEDITNTTIPKELKNGQMQLAIDLQDLDGGLAPTGTGQAIKREKVDVIETEYQDGGSIAPQPVFAKAFQFLNPLLKTGGVLGGLGSTLRI